MDWSQLLRDTWQTSLVFISLFAFTRFLGKTQVAQLTFYEYISGITLGSIAGNIAAAESDKFLSHFYDLFIFVILTYFVSYLTLKSRPLRNIIEGQPTMVVRDGVIIKENMAKLRYDLEELTAQLRQQGVLDVSEVQFATLESTGDLSVIKKAAQQPITKMDLGITQPESLYPVEVIMDGIVLTDNLKRKNLSDAWLSSELSMQGIQSPSEVLYAVIDSKGSLFASKTSARQ